MRWDLDKEEDWTDAEILVDPAIGAEVEVLTEEDLEAGELDLTTIYTDLGFEMEPLVWRGKTISGRQIISKGGRYVADVSSKYTVIPNELVSELGVEIAKETNAELFNDASNNDRLYQYYTIPDEWIGPEAELNPGFLLINSIDGSTSCCLQAFLYRSICSNGQIMGRKSIAGLWARHTANVVIDLASFVKKGIEVIEIARTFAKAQEDWPAILLETELGDGLLESVRDSGIPNLYLPEYANYPTKRIPRSKIPKAPDGANLWELYNEITSSLTRPPDNRSLSERTRIDYHNDLVKALEPALVLSDRFRGEEDNGSK